MIIIPPSYEVLTDISEGGQEELQQIEQIARTCYKSEDAIKEGSAEKLVTYLIKHDHTAMLEHSQLSVKFIVDRGVSHELVRHRHCGFAQESTRYCNYSKDKFGNNITFIAPTAYFDYENSETKEIYADDPELLKEINKAWKENLRYHLWLDQMEKAEKAYFALLKCGASPQEARAVLPTSLKTELVITASYREWRSIFKLRCASDAHPDTRYIMRRCLAEVKQRIPIIFDDITY